MPDKRDAFRRRNSALAFVSIDEAYEYEEYEAERNETEERTAAEQCVMIGMYRGMR